MNTSRIIQGPLQDVSSYVEPVLTSPRTFIILLKQIQLGFNS